MLKSLNEIKVIKKENKELWLKYLYETSEKKYNVLNVKSLKEITKHSVFNYVLRTLEILDRLKNELNLEDDIIYYVEETLKWSDVSKTGDKKTRSMWKKKKYDLFCHNIASAQIYLENYYDEIVYTLIKTHGLVGQNIKGEVNLNKNIELYNLIKEGKISSEKLKTILLVLNQCIIEGVSEELYISIRKKVEYTIEKIINGEFDEEIALINRIVLLNKGLSGEDKQYIKELDKVIIDKIINVFNRLELWFFDAAMCDFTVEEQIKVLLLSEKYVSDKTYHLSLEALMRSLYLDY